MGTRYISPTGAGDKSGSSLENSAPVSALDAQIGKAGAGGEVLLIADAGTYKTAGIIPVSHGGADGLPVTIRGIDHDGAAMAAQFTGTRPTDWRAGDAAGNELFKLGSGANHLVFQDIDISNVGTAFRASADIADITIEQIDVHNARRFFEDLASSDSATISGLTIRNVDVTGFSRNAIRLQYDTHGIVIENVRGDMAGQVGDDLPEGIHLDGTVHDVLIRDTTMANVQSVGTGSTYLNGDGFATERGVYGVRFENTLATGNSDGGYDLKSADTVLIGAVASENARNYRFWGDVTMSNSVGLNPVWHGGSAEQNQLWVAAGAHVTITDSAFADAGSRTKVISSEGALILDGVQIVHAVDSILFTSGSLLSLAGLSTLAESIVASVGGGSAGWSAADPAFAAWIDAVIHGVSASDFAGTAGDDRYFIDSARDTITEAASGGIDHVATTLTKYTLGANLENLAHVGLDDFAGTGNALANVITGGVGHDTLFGRNGDDTLNGGHGQDTLLGGRRADTLDGGAGDDRLVGGAGADHFVFAVGSGKDEILDFSSAQGDRIDLSAFGAAAASFTTTLSDDGLSIHVGDSMIVLHDVFALHPYDLVLV